MINIDITEKAHDSLDVLKNNDKLYCLGIDGGGTKTELSLADRYGNIIRTLKTGACNPIDIGLDAVKNILKDAIYEICTDIPLSSVYVFAGIAGGTTANMKEQLNDFLNEFDFAGFSNDSDNKNIIAAGLGTDDGMTVIMGTGVCVFTQKNNRHNRIAGWGYLIDNGGSGYNFGRDALNAYFAAIDGTGNETILLEEIDKIYSGGAQKLMGHIYNGGKKVVASFAPAVFAALEKEDKTAIEILKRNVAEVAHFVETAAKIFDDKKIPVVLAGGLTNQPSVIECLKNTLHDCERYEFKTLNRPPVYGAVILARQLLEERGINNA